MSKEINEIGKSKQMITMQLPISLLLRVDSFAEKENYESRTSAFKELLNVGLFISERRKEFETIFKNPELMDELNTQLREGGLVDFVQRMKWDEFQVVWSIMKNEAKDRKLV